MPNVGVFVAVFDDQKRILCVKMNYGPKSWTLPGGRMDKPGESPIQTAKREAAEEAACTVEPRRLIGVYSEPSKDDVILLVEAELIAGGEWEPNDEISEIGFFGWNELPRPMDAKNLMRIQDAFEGRAGILRVLDPDLGSE
jgi:8-oxo-dGTP diphosphatase